MIPADLSCRLSSESFNINCPSLKFTFTLFEAQNATVEASVKLKAKRVCDVCVLYDVLYCLCCINVFMFYAC